VNWTDWSTLKDVCRSLRCRRHADIQLEAELDAGFGVTRYLGDDWRISGGYMYSENSVPDGNFNPLVPDSDRHIFSSEWARNAEVSVGMRLINWPGGRRARWGDATAFGTPDGKYEFLAMPLPSTSATTSESGSASADKPRRTLLIVDDEEGPRQSLRVVFKEDYTLLLASNGHAPWNWPENTRSTPPCWTSA
jgi:hypothetical protein